jgi:acetyltransferase-like isoleucine patch superfamily enzyme
VSIGFGSVIEADVRIGANCTIGHNVVIHQGTVISSNVRIDDNTVIGKLPMKAAISVLKMESDLPPGEIADDVMIGACVTIYRGCKIGRKVLVADLASVRENTTVGKYTIVGKGVTVENHCKVGNYCKLETESYITAYSELEDRVFISPGVVTSNDNYIGRTEERFRHFKGITVKKGGRVGAGSVVLPGRVIGKDALVAAGSVVTKDVPERMIVMGSPAKRIRPVPEEQLLENQGWVDED